MRSNRAPGPAGGTAPEHLRRERRLVQHMLADLADLAGITKAMLSAYGTGRRCPSLLTLVKLIAAMGTSWQHLGRALVYPERPHPLAES